uniref:tRNA (guanine(37)-N(1))-methyltransferase n=2 Tax=Giardia intestinalis (strain ATCC 50803 / WB clone C6) TaxID=184922 RepID=TRM5_GIAIC|nr:RecName: Full=tRNA (guanine(37)-N1)-methyltransferase; AltName: Full=M1G-methyltransferase; AltName: Full=tRNA [GM37] methyltransferase; AltName: Full=tRNA methyltransferase 5 homolog [Giardia lamblia ATCC 50803]|eukprot:XP_001709660.1 Met-10+ protein [Giardia lamblia ATCC 50803]
MSHQRPEIFDNFAGAQVMTVDGEPQRDLNQARRIVLEMKEPLCRIPEDLRSLLSVTISVYCIETPSALVSTIIKNMPPEASIALVTGCRFLAVRDGPRGKTVTVLSTAFLSGLDESVTQQLFIHADTLLLTPEARSRISLLQDIIEDPPTSFETVGHIAHYNLREAHLPYRYFIGAVTCEKEPAITTVITKIDTVQSQYRTYNFELIGGVPRYDVKLVQDGITYSFNYTKVYWNSRLSHEHLSLAQHINQTICPNDLVLDGTCGIGPHALLLAKRFNFTNLICNDLNPDAYKSLKMNVRINKAENAITCFNEDVSSLLRRLLPETNLKAVIFSLPELSINLLQAMKGVPDIYCFLECFTRAPPHLAYYDLLLRCSESLLDTKVCTGIQQALSDIEKVAENKELIDLLIACYETFEVKEIRTVSTNKFMYRVTLKINEQKETVKVLKK